MEEVPERLWTLVLSRMDQGFSQINTRLDKFEDKIGSVVEQCARLDEREAVVEQKVERIDTEGCIPGCPNRVSKKKTAVVAAGGAVGGAGMWEAIHRIIEMVNK
jgi:hypothetical protein